MENLNDILNLPPGQKLCLGWKEWILLPDLGILGMTAKIDSGAKTSALHAQDIQIVEKAGKTYARFKIFPELKNKKKYIVKEAKILEKRSIKSSTGHISQRPIIMTSLQIGGFLWAIELSLVERSFMGFQMLLGREAIRHRFLIDPGKTFLMGKNLETKEIQKYEIKNERKKK